MLIKIHYIRENCIASIVKGDRSILGNTADVEILK